MNIKKYHYVYRITNLQEQKYYYGTRTSKNILPKDDLGIKYFSSSKDKKFIKDQKENSEIFKYKVIKIFKTRKEALAIEVKLHKKFNVGKNIRFYNKAKQTSTGYDTEGTSFKHKKSTIEKIKKKRKLQVFSEDSKLKSSLSNIEYKRKTGHGKKAYKVTVYDNNGNKLFTSIGSLKEDCKKYGISYNAIRKSYTNNEKMYSKKLAGVSKELQNFRGYYAILEKKE